MIDGIRGFPPEADQVSDFGCATSKAPNPRVKLDKIQCHLGCN